MRPNHRLLTLAAALAALGACHKPAPAPAASAHIAIAENRQAPGLWVERVADRHGARETRYCLDAAASTALAAFDRRLNAHCARHDMAQAADGTWHFSTSCDMGAAGKVASEGVMRGDFRSHYVVEAQTQTVGAADAADDGPGRVSADVRRAGDCPSGMKPGDVILPGGAHARLGALGASA